VPFVPPRITPKPRIRAQTAVVVGDKETDEDLVDTDEAGVSVQFHWDRQGKKDRIPCWKSASPEPGRRQLGRRGFAALGQEVLVSFLDGDPDRRSPARSTTSCTAAPRPACRQIRPCS
jgi:type VI secretion system secreted protein VgrG